MIDLKNFETDAEKMLADNGLTDKANHNAMVMAPLVDKPFTITGIDKVTVSGEPRENFTPLTFKTSVGFNVPVRVIAAVEGLPLSIGTSVKDIAIAACALKSEATEFVLTSYKKSQGTYGGDDYKPAKYECELN